ncbi:MAG: KpsF/GutQ family sugar-phosphate isomerase [Puniceicoccales bacterium]|nr:KpsF/GutQ family sugar-phosphate isomerase [Puniceicoccales bacterium]
MAERNGAGIRAGRCVLQGEIEGLNRLLTRIEEPLAATLALLGSSRRKILVCGVGKSGHIGRKIAATLNSTGHRSVFLHPCEALHGDLGIYEAGDPILLLSKSGSSEELLRLIPFFKQHHSPLIAILGNSHNPIVRYADIVFDTGVGPEGDPLGLVPTTSAVLSLAVGDAIACALMAEHPFSRQDFAQIHPAGQLGRNLLLQVRELMHPLKAVAHGRRDSSLRHVVIAMTERPLGAALILDGVERLIGLITDGDIRRFLQEGQDIDRTTAEQIMCRHFRFIGPECSLGEAIDLMEEGPSQVQVLPVLSRDGENHEVLGLLRLHDAYRRP